MGKLNALISYYKASNERIEAHQALEQELQASVNHNTHYFGIHCAKRRLLKAMKGFKVARKVLRETPWVGGRSNIGVG